MVLLCGCSDRPKLVARLENPRWEVRGIVVDFVLRNLSSQPIHVAKQWHSWGADQWSLRVTNADGGVVKFRNSQWAWTRNFIETEEIPPYDELRMPCLLAVQEPSPFVRGLDVFLAEEKGAIFGPPVKIVGVFKVSKEELKRARADVREGAVAPDWAGEIESPAVTLAATGEGPFDREVELVAMVLNDQAHEREVRRVREILAEAGIEDSGFTMMGVSVSVPAKRASEARARLAEAVRKEGLDISLLKTRWEEMKTVPVTPEEAMAEYGEAKGNP